MKIWTIVKKIQGLHRGLQADLETNNKKNARSFLFLLIDRMFRLSKKIILKCIYYYRYMTWVYDYYFILSKNRDSRNIKYDISYFENKKIISVIPHADDELFGGFNFYKKVKKNLKFQYFGLSGGKPAEEINKIRLNEFDSLCIEEGFDYVHIIDPLVDLVNHIDESVDIIMLPSYVDWQPDHRLVNDIVLEYLKKSKLNPEIMLYNITVPLSDKFTNYVHPISKKEQNYKYLIFDKYYASQRSMPTKRFIYQERTSGKLISKYAGERFYLLSLKEYIEIVGMLNKDFQKRALKKLHHYINSLRLVYKKSKEIYDFI